MPVKLGERMISPSPNSFRSSCSKKLLIFHFLPRSYADHYDTLKITILNRTDGPVDTLTLNFKDLLGMKPVPHLPRCLILHRILRVGNGREHKVRTDGDVPRLGPVDTLTLNFKDLLGMKPVPNNPNFRDGVAPHIWNYNGKVEWYSFRSSCSKKLLIFHFLPRK